MIEKFTTIEGEEVEIDAILILATNGKWYAGAHFGKHGLAIMKYSIDGAKWFKEMKSAAKKRLAEKPPKK